MGNPADFMGFERPRADINARTWKERLYSLADGHTDKWAKYGPFTSLKAARNTSSRIKGVATSMNLQIRTTVQGNEKGEHFLFVKVTTDGI